jgi:hypothetical protein
VLFSALVYYFYRSTKIATQNKLWAEWQRNAHQIDFLYRMGEILKSENVDESTTIEIEKILSDYKPLQTVSQKLAQNPY